MSQWIKKSPIPNIQLAVVNLAAYFLMYRFSFFTLLIFFLLVVRLFHQYGKRRAWKTMTIVMIFLAIFGLHSFRQQLFQQDSSDQVSLIRPIPDTIRVKGDQLSFQGKSGGKKYQVFYQLKSQEEQAYFKQLDELVEFRFQGNLSTAEGRRNFNGFDYRAQLQTKDIRSIVKMSEIQTIQTYVSWNPFEWISLLRRKALLHIRMSFPAPMCHYMTGLLLGDLDSDFEEMEEIYSSLGIIHLFALSGMQVGFFVDKLRYFLLRLGIKKETVHFWQIPFSIFYAGITGFSISVIRSLVQKILGNYGLRGLDNVAFTLAICYFLMPHFLLSAGGVLSFAYAFLLSVFDFEKISGFKRIILESMAISLGILPFLIFYFYSFQPLSIGLTFVFSIVFDLVFLPLLTIIFLLSPLVMITQVNGLFIGVETVITAVAQLVRYPLIFGKPTIFVLLALLLLLAFIYDAFHRKKWVIVSSCLLLALLFVTKQPMVNEVTMIDVGQGDSLLVRDKSGKAILIDVGGRVHFEDKEAWQKKTVASNAERTLIPYLKSRGIGKIDQLVLTHTDTDHVGDLEVVAQEMKIGELLVSPGSLTDEEFVKRLRAIHVKVRTVQAGESLSIMDSQLHILYPFETGDGGNNDSLVLYGRLLNKNFLFTGDLEEAGEEVLINTYPNLPVDVLKAGHHGSKGSSSEAFLDHIQPELALLSAGKDNRYKHPHQETLEHFSQRTIRSLRTDQQGAIRFIGWSKWKLETVK